MGAGRLAQADSDRSKKYNHHIYDDQTIENMVRYYKIEDFDTLLRYIKGQSLHEDVA